MDGCTLASDTQLVEVQLYSVEDSGDCLAACCEILEIHRVCMCQQCLRFVHQTNLASTHLTEKRLARILACGPVCVRINYGEQ